MPAKISFASFNLYNFQKAGLKTYGSKLVTQTEYNEKRNWTQKMLRELGADVVAFQELWNKDCLIDVLSLPEFSNYKAIFLKPSWYNKAMQLMKIK